MLLTSAEKKNKEIVDQLVDLWKTVFGDDEEYIRLFEPYLDSFDCYAVRENGKIVSAFYLLGAEIKFNGKIYKGKYLYAAATLDDFRKKGYMSSLIKEAIADNCKKIDFISLVPADESLYLYYSRFGFEALMYNYRTKILCNGASENESENILDGAYINKLRKDTFDNFHLFTDEAMRYALSCYGFFGSFFKNIKGCMTLYISDEKTVYESFFNENKANEYLAFLRNNYSGEISVVTPYSLNETTERIKCGMIYDFSGDLMGVEKIYMNHTLI